MACFVINDALVKYASQTMPTSQLIFLRGVMATLLVFGVTGATGAIRRWAVVLQPLVVVRALLDAVATMLYLVSLFHLPIGNATAINLAAPIAMTVFAALFMAERVGVSRWLAILGGFIGVVLIIQPSADGFNVYALVCLLGTLFHAARDLLTRRIPVQVPSLLITLATAVAVTILSGGLSAVEGWKPFGRLEFGLLALASGFLAGGYHLIIMSMRSGEISLVAPFRYSALLFAIVIGFVVWGEFPNALAWFGIVLLIGSGLQVLTRERNRPAAARLVKER